MKSIVLSLIVFISASAYAQSPIQKELTLVSDPVSGMLLDAVTGDDIIIGCEDVWQAFAVFTGKKVKGQSRMSLLSNTSPSIYYSTPMPTASCEQTASALASTTQAHPAHATLDSRNRKILSIGL